MQRPSVVAGGSCGPLPVASTPRTGLPKVLGQREPGWGRPHRSPPDPALGLPLLCQSRSVQAEHLPWAAINYLSFQGATPAEIMLSVSWSVFRGKKKRFLSASARCRQWFGVAPEICRSRPQRCAP